MPGDSRSQADLSGLISRACWDPGAIVKRENDYTEPVASWQARAVKKVLADHLDEMRLHDDTGDRLDEGYMNAVDQLCEALGLDRVP